MLVQCYQRKRQKVRGRERVRGREELREKEMYAARQEEGVFH